MQRRTLGSTGLEVSVIGVGTWQFGGEWGRTYSRDEADAVFDAARDCDINLVDTAECYGDHLSEQLVGDAIRRDRDRWIVATKFGHAFHSHMNRTVTYDPDAVRQQLEDSLRALRTDVIDLYQFHSGPDDQFDRDELWDMLRRQREAGKIRHLGVSIGANTNTHQTGRARDVGAEAIQVVYNRLDRAPEQEVLPICERDQLGVLARVPLASGFLSGKYDEQATFPDDDVRSGWPRERVVEAVREVRRIQADEAAPGESLSTWALRWCLRHPAVTCVIPGCKDAAQVRANAAAGEPGSGEG